MLLIALKCRVLPAFMSVRMIGTDSADPFNFGGYADIFKGTYRGGTVALKRFRRNESQDTHETERIIRVRRFNCLHRVLALMR